MVIMKMMTRKTNKIGLVVMKNLDVGGTWYHYWCAGEQDRLPDSELKWICTACKLDS